MTGRRWAQIHALAFGEGWSETEFDSLLGQSGVFATQTPDGFLIARQVADEAEILTLAVLPDRRRNGQGRALVEAAVAEAAERGARRLFLEVAVDNQAAIGLYQACGFHQLGLRRGYYSRPGGAVDALVLARDV